MRPRPAGDRAGLREGFQPLPDHGRRSPQRLFKDRGKERERGSGGAGGNNLRDRVAGDADLGSVFGFLVGLPVLSYLRDRCRKLHRIESSRKMNAVRPCFERNRASTRRIAVDKHPGGTPRASNCRNNPSRKLEEFSIGEVSFPNLNEIHPRGRPESSKADELLSAFSFGIGEEDAAGDGAEKH